MIFFRIVSGFFDLAHRFFLKYISSPIYKGSLGYCGKNVAIRWSKAPNHMSRIYLYDNTSILDRFNFISVTGKLIMKCNSGSAEGLTVITGNHQRIIGDYFVKYTGSHEYDVERDVIIEEDVWLGANVTLLSGVTVGRGATVGAGSVCMKSIPPYAVVMGNPAKVVGFNFVPEQIVEHEAALYQPEDRIPLETLEKNYKKYFLDRVQEIKSFTKI